MSSRASAWPSGSLVSSRHSTSSTCSRICSVYAVCQAMSVRTMDPEFIARSVRDWIAAVGSATAYIEPGSSWRTGTARASTRSCATNSQRRGVLHAQGSPRRDRAMAEALQHPPTALVARLPAACARSRYLANRTERISAVRPSCHRHTTDDALTSNPGHRMGAGHQDGRQRAEGLRVAEEENALPRPIPAIWSPGLSCDTLKLDRRDNREIRLSGSAIPPWQRAVATGKVAYPPAVASSSTLRFGAAGGRMNAVAMMVG